MSITRAEKKNEIKNRSRIWSVKKIADYLLALHVSIFNRQWFHQKYDFLGNVKKIIFVALSHNEFSLQSINTRDKFRDDGNKKVYTNERRT